MGAESMFNSETEFIHLNIWRSVTENSCGNQLSSEVKISAPLAGDFDNYVHVCFHFKVKILFKYRAELISFLLFSLLWIAFDLSMSCLLFVFTGYWISECFPTKCDKYKNNKCHSLTSVVPSR